MLEWIGLTIVKRYLSKNPLLKVEDVHSDSRFFDKGIDLILRNPEGSTVSVDLKADSYYGSSPDRKIRGLCNPDSGVILLETISQLQFERERTTDPNGTLPTKRRPDVPGWFFTSKADEVYYYYVAVLNSRSDLSPLYEEYAKNVRSGESVAAVEDRLMRNLKVERDLLVSYRIAEARNWYNTAAEKAFAGYAGAVNPNYVTVSRRARREEFIAGVRATIHESIFSKI